MKITRADYRLTAEFLYSREGDLEIDPKAPVSLAKGSDLGAYVQAWIWVADEDVQRVRLQLLFSQTGLQVRHDHLGWYICTAAEAAKEDRGHQSAGFDGRSHWSNQDDAVAALKKSVARLRKGNA